MRLLLLALILMIGCSAVTEPAVDPQILSLSAGVDSYSQPGHWFLIASVEMSGSAKAVMTLTAQGYQETWSRDLPSGVTSWQVEIPELSGQGAVSLTVYPGEDHKASEVYF
jgi:hypothetical protein